MRQNNNSLLCPIMVIIVPIFNNYSGNVHSVYLVTYVMSCIYTLYMDCAFVVLDNHMTKALTCHSVLNSLIRINTPNKQHGSHHTLGYTVLSHI